MRGYAPRRADGRERIHAFFLPEQSRHAPGWSVFQCVCAVYARIRHCRHRRAACGKAGFQAHGAQKAGRSQAARRVCARPRTVPDTGNTRAAE